MALPPNIPTSFVPKQAMQSASSHVVRRHGANPINIVAPAILIIAVLAAGAVYVYGEHLTRTKTKKAIELTAQEGNINQQAVEEFIRLRDRLLVGNRLLREHVTLSTFLAKLETMTLQNVRFRSLSVTVAPDRTAEIRITGEARSFNALAAQSTAFSSDPAIRRAIFSGVRQNNDGTVDFSLTATIVQSLVTGGAAATASAAPVPAPAVTPATTTPTVTPAETMPGAAPSVSTSTTATSSAVSATTTTP